jgi:hypothetical protein
MLLSSWLLDFRKDGETELLAVIDEVLVEEGTVSWEEVLRPLR